MTEFEKYIQRYLDLIPSEDWMEEMAKVGEETIKIYQNLTADQARFAYDENKWSLKVLLQHMIDTEKVFAYRALRFSRNDQSLVSGFDEEAWANSSFGETRDLENLIKEFDLTRKLSVIFFENLPKQALGFVGFVNDNEIKVEQIAKLIIGHNIHHLNIIKERYLPKL